MNQECNINQEYREENSINNYYNGFTVKPYSSKIYKYYNCKTQFQ